MTDYALVSHFYPALGDPFNMTVNRFNALLDRIEDVIEMQKMEPRPAIFRQAERLRIEDPERYWNP